MGEDAKRETTGQLMARMKYAADIVPAGFTARHVKTGGEYMVRGHCLRLGDLEPMVNYSPLTGPVVVFSRPVMDFRAKFVRCDGVEWGSDDRPIQHWLGVK